MKWAVALSGSSCRAVRLLERLAQPLLLRVDRGQVVVRVGGARIELDGALELLDRLVEPAAVGQLDATGVVLVGAVGGVLVSAHGSESTPSRPARDVMNRRTIVIALLVLIAAAAAWRLTRPAPPSDEALIRTLFAEAIRAAEERRVSDAVAGISGAVPGSGARPAWREAAGGRQRPARELAGGPDGRPAGGGDRRRGPRGARPGGDPRRRRQVAGWTCCALTERLAEPWPVLKPGGMAGGIVARRWRSS